MRACFSAVLAAASVLIPQAPAAAQQHTLSGDDVAIYNLAGRIVVRGSSGSDVVVNVSPAGRDARQLRVERGDVAGRSTLRVFAVATQIVYPELGRGSRTTLRIGEDGTFFDAVSATRSVRISGRGRGVEAYADLEVLVPAGRTVRLFAGVGRIDANNVEGALHIRTTSARSEVRQVRGPVHVHTSSGGATIENVTGSVRVSSSSGRVRVTQARGGHQEVRTSSGSIDASGLVGDAVRLTSSSGSIRGGSLRGGDIEARASSGTIRLDGLEADRFLARTSSGGIRVQNLAAREIDVGASSGTIDLAVSPGVHTLTGQTSSGGFRAALPQSFAGEVQIRTGSGSINFDLPVTADVTRRNELVGRIGNDGTGVLRVRTSSGSVRITGR